MKRRVPVYEKSNKGFFESIECGPLGYIFIDPQNPFIKYDSFRRLMRRRSYSWSYLFICGSDIPCYDLDSLDVVNPDGTVGDQFIIVF